MEFSKWMQENCERKGVNVTQLAELLKENQPTLYRIYKGASKNPHLRIIEKLEQFFGVKYSKDGLGVKQEPAEYSKGKSVIIGGKVIPPLHQLMLDKYLLLSGSSQNAIDMMVNRLYSLEHPNDLTATPTNGKKKKEKV